MSMKTIQSDLIVHLDPNSRSGKKNLDHLPKFDAVAWCRLCERAYQHALLIDRISEQIKQNPDVLTWIYAAQNAEDQNSADMDTETDTEQGYSWLPDGLISGLCALLKNTPQFEGMSGRAYTSATDRVEENFKGWFASHQKLLFQIKGKQHWLTVVESDAGLAEISNFNQSEIENQAKQILDEIEAENESKDESVNNHRRVFNILFDKFDATEDILSRRAIIHLLKNGGKVRWEPKKSRNRKSQKHSSNPMTLEERLVAKRIEIARLEKQLLSQLPRARNLFPDIAFEESLQALLTLPDPDLERHNQYYFLVFSLLIHKESLEQNTQFQWHLLKSMDLLWEKPNSLCYYRILIFSFLLCAISTQKYLQFGHHLLQAIQVEVERVESQFYDWHESITFKLSEFLREPKSLPYPISFGYEDVRAWQINQAGKIFFKLNGWGDLIFEVRCHRRQLPLIKSFLKDWQTKEQCQEGDQYSGSLMLLRSIELVWKPKPVNKQNDTQLCSQCEVFQQYPGKGFWNECKLSIHWSYDSDALSKQGLEKVRQRKLEPQLEKLRKKQEELEEKQQLLQSIEEVPEALRSKVQSKKMRSLTKAIQELQDDLAKPRPKLDCLQNSLLFDRPDRPLYEGVPNIFVGVLLDLDKHLVVTVVDAMRRKILAIRNASSISKEGYDLLQSYFHQRREHSKQRQINQKAHRHVHQSESNLGQHVARLFAKGIVELAQKYKASTIVIPETDGWRDRLYSQLVARAAIKCKGVKKAMARYTKKHGEELHQWDYSRLSQAIIDRATTDGLKVMRQNTVYEEDTFQQAANLAIAAYDSLNLLET
ncbi:MAG: hypothetical protein Kow00121_06590 [Elainellaceae cyanobacterium]